MTLNDPKATRQAFRRACEQHRRQSGPSDQQPPTPLTHWDLQRSSSSGKASNDLRNDLVVNGMSEQAAIHIVDSLRRLVHGTR